MSGEKIVILDGLGSNDRELLPILGLLAQVIQKVGNEPQTFHLSEMKLAHCLGCFDCWIKTPGVCVEADAGREIAKAVINSDVTVFFTPVTFGGYSPELKKVLERFIQLLSPFFAMDHGEVHHPPRYARRPRLVMIGVQRQDNPSEAQIFRTLAGRNAINFHPPSYAAEVVLASDNEDTLRARLEVVLTRSDVLPFGDEAASLMPAPVSPGSRVQITGGRRALLLVGSPKTNEASTSGALGGFLLDRLSERGWETETLTLRAKLRRPEGESELASMVEPATLLLLVFPLYGDALPYLVTKALTQISAHRQAGQRAFPQRLMAICNSGFPETHQNAVALAICREFAEQCGFQWAGSLAFGGGGMIGGHPLAEKNRPGPSVRHVTAALEMTAACLAEGLPVPAEAVRMIAKKGIPAALWNRFYVRMGSWSFEKLAAKNGLSKAELLQQPYAT